MSAPCGLCLGQPLSNGVVDDNGTVKCPRCGRESKRGAVRSAATGFPQAVSNLTWSLDIRETNLAAEKKKRDRAQAMVDQFQASVEKIEAEVEQMRDELERLTRATA